MSDPPHPLVPVRLWDLEQVVGHGERELRRVAGRQRGMIVREQLLDAGIGRGAITHRLGTGALVIVHRTVYLVGHDALVPFALEMAAALRFRGHAVLSHGSAAAIWGLVAHPPREIELTLVGRDCRPGTGIRVVRARTLHRKDFRWHDGLPVTSPARTMIDVAGSDDDQGAQRALSELRVHGLARDSELEAAMARNPNRKGVGALRALLADERGPMVTRSEAERRLLGLLRRAELPMPAGNVQLCGFEVDALWIERKLVLEVDGYVFHGHRPAFEGDRRRDQTLVAAGYRVIRVTWRQLQTEPLAVVARVAQALSAAAPGG